MINFIVSLILLNFANISKTVQDDDFTYFSTSTSKKLDVNVGGVKILTIRGNLAKERVFFVEERLCLALSPNLSDKNIYLKKTGNDYSVMVNDVLLYTITQEDAKLNKTDLHTFANMTLERLKKILPEVAPVK